MEAGFAKACISPPLGMEMEGLGQVGGCKSVHDDLFVRALYLRQGRQEAAIVALDLCFLERADVDRFKAAVGRQTRLKPESILVNFSHNHAGPRMTHWAYSGGADAKYLQQVGEAMTQAVAAARGKLQPVALWAGMGKTDLPVSRRKLVNGKAEWAPSLAAAVCDALPVCVLKASDGKVVSILFSVSCHPSIYHDTDISAEYPGVATSILNERLKTDGAMFLQGAGGDTKPRPIAEGEVRWLRGTMAHVRQAGESVAAGVIRTVEQGLASVEPDLKAALVETRWPLEPAPKKAYLEAVVAEEGGRPARKAWATDCLNRLRQGPLPSHAGVLLHVLRLGPDCRIVGLEGEAVGELGLLILSQFARGVTFPLGYTDGAQLYLPVTRMLSEGGYEADSFWEYHFPSALAPGMEEVIARAITDIRARLGDA